MSALSNILKSPCIGCALLIMVQSSCAGSDYIAAGMEFYDRGDYKKAADYFYGAAKRTPKSAEARYHLANSLVKLGRLPEAYIQYQATISLDRDSSLADYSRQALLVFKGEHAEAAATKSHFQLMLAAKAPFPDRSQEEEAQEIRRAAKATDVQTSLAERAINDEGTKAVSRLAHEAATTIGILESQKQAEIAAAVGRTYQSKDEVIKAIGQDYQQRIDVVRADSKRRSDEVLAECKSRISALEESAVNSSYALHDNKRTGNVRAIPLASNLHVRNYEIEERPSGDLIPSIAKPATALKSVVRSK